MSNWLYTKIEQWLGTIRGKKYVRDDYFAIREEYSDQGLLPIEVLRGPYKGTVFVVTEFHIVDDYGRVKFNHSVIRKIPGKHDSYYGDKFSREVGEILLVCLEEAGNNFKSLRAEVLADDVDELDIVEEFTPQRTVSKEGSTTPQA